jgi:hypothetical protein
VAKAPVPTPQEQRPVETARSPKAAPQKGNAAILGISRGLLAGIAGLVLVGAGITAYWMRPKPHRQAVATPPPAATGERPPDRVEPPPADVQPASLNFLYQPGGPAPQPQAITVTGSPDGKDPQKSAGWLTVTRRNGMVVIAKGAAVTGVLVDAAGKKAPGHSSPPTFRPLEVAAADGTKVKLRAIQERGASSNDAPLAIAAAGSQFVAYLDGDQTVTLRK